MKKIILGITIAVILLLVIGLVALGLSLDGIVKRGVETVGPKLTQTTVRLDTVSLSLLSGGGHIGGLVVGNPEGFKTPNAISVGKASLVVQPSSLMSDKVVIRTVRVEAPEITLETGLNGNNLKKIVDNLNAATASAAPAAPAKDGGPGKKLQVDDFLISGAKLNVTVAGVGNQILTLPEIHLTNLGNGSDGITSAELTKVVLTEILSVATKFAAEHAGDLVKSASNLVNKDAANVIKGLTGTNAAVEKLGKGLGDLLKKK